MLGIIKIVIGVLLVIATIQFWIGFFVYSKLKTPPQMATVIQMHIVTVAALGVIFGGSLWLVPIGIIFWFLSKIITPAVMLRHHTNPVKARNISFILPFIYAMLFSYSIALHHKWDLLYTMIGIIVVVFILKKATEIIGSYLYFRR